VSAAKAAKSTLLAFRLPDDLIARVDAYVARLSSEAQWTRVTRADAVRALLAQALDANGVPTAATPKTRR
jgi:hypothetical protein